MKCQNCGNEVRPGEAFCGQCGTPVVPSSPPTNQTEMMSAPPRSGMLTSYSAHPSQASFVSPSGQQGTSYIPPKASTSSASPLSSVSPSPLPNAVPSSQAAQPPLATRPIHQSAGSFGRFGQPGQQQEDFYQDATEAIPHIPQNAPQRYAPNYPGQFSATPPSSQYSPIGAAPTQYGGQPGAYNASGQQGLQGPQTPPFQQQFPSRHVPQPPARQSGNPGVLIVSILLALALITIVGLGTLYMIHNHNNDQATSNAAATSAAATSTTAANAVNATVTASANATATAASAPTATATAVPSPTVAPSPTAAPTQPVDANFTYCGQTCNANGYEIEYPDGWNLSPAGDNISIQFINPSQQDIFAITRTPPPAASSASAVVANDLQTYYASKPGYMSSAPTTTVVIGGETWVQAASTYQNDTQKETIEVFGTIHAGKSYVIEFQAPDEQFNQMSGQYFNNMTNRFRFQQ